jgi:hypothetical protein
MSKNFPGKTVEIAVTYEFPHHLVCGFLQRTFSLSIKLLLVPFPQQKKARLMKKEMREKRKKK